MDARARARDEVVEVCRHLADAGLLIGTAGNVSVAFDGPSGPEVAITATGVVLGRAERRDVSVLTLEGEQLDGDLAPTSEAELHLGLLRERGGALVHTHSSTATALSLVIDELPCLHYQQLSLGGSVRVAPFAVFGTPELAEHVRTAMHRRQAAILANHGTVAMGADLAQATANAELLEWAAELYWRASAVGQPRSLTDQQQNDVLVAALSTGYGRPRKVDTGAHPD